MSKKYSFEFKLKVVQEYLAGKGGSMYLAEKYNVTAHSLVQKWIAQYNKYGQEVFIIYSPFLFHLDF